MFDARHGHQILLSGDLARRSYWHSYSGGAAPGFRFILTRFVPLLKEHGLSDSMIQMMLVENPARAFSFLPK
jgi:phosphotriesterase-related protein